MTVNMGLTNFVPMIAQWQLQSDKDIYDAIDDWGLHKFICVMKDGKQVEVSGVADESECGVCSKYIDFDSNYGSEDIVFWCEIPATPSLDCIEIYGVDKIIKTIESTREQFLQEIEKKKDEEMAEEYAKAHIVQYPKRVIISENGFCTSEDEVKQAFLAGLKAGRPQWHRPSEKLPKTTVFNEDGIKVYYDYDIKRWRYDDADEYLCDTPVAWCEIPTFDKE